MTPDARMILELFDLPGADREPTESIWRDKEPKTPEDAAHYGRKCMEEGDYDGAIAHFKRAITLGKTDPQAILDLGGAYESADQMPQAFRQYLRAARAHANGELHLAIGDLYQRFGRRQEAIAAYESAIQSDPNNAYHHLKLAELLRAHGYRTDALRAIQSAIALQGEDPFYHWWAGDLLIDLKRYDEALECFRAAIEFSPGDDHVTYLTALAFWGAGKRAEAIRAIRLAGDLDPEKLHYTGLLAFFLREEGHLADADQERARVEKMDCYDRDLLERSLKRIGLDPA